MSLYMNWYRNAPRTTYELRTGRGSAIVSREGVVRRARMATPIAATSASLAPARSPTLEIDSRPPVLLDPAVKSPAIVSLGKYCLQINDLVYLPLKMK